MKKYGFVHLFCLILMLGNAVFAQEYLVPAGEGDVRINNGGTHNYDGIIWTLSGVNLTQRYAVVKKGNDPVEEVDEEDYTIFSGGYIVFCTLVDGSGALLSFGESNSGYVSFDNTTVTGAPGSRISFIGSCGSTSFVDSDPRFYNDKTANSWFHHYLFSSSNNTYTTYFDIPAGTASGDYEIWISVPLVNKSMFLRKLIIRVQSISPPSPPSLISPINNANASGTTINFAWSGVSGATNYWVQISRNSSFSNLFYDGAVGNYVIVAISGFPNDGTVFYWRARVQNSAGWGSYGSAEDFVNGSIPTPSLSSPANNATNISINPTLSWNSVSSATSYSLQVSTNSSFSSLVVNQSGISGTSYSVNLNYNTTYYWRVNATNSGGTSGWSSRTFTTMQEPVVAPDDPTLVSPNNGATNVSINTSLSWNSAARAVSYSLQVSTNSSFSSLVVNQSGISGTSYSVNLNYNTTYYWRVNATNSGGTSGWSSRTFTTMQEPVVAPDDPTLVSPNNGATNVSINTSLSWNSAARAVSYSLQVSTNSSFSSLVVNQSGISGTSYSVNLNYNTTYYWRVNATNSSGTSLWCSPFIFTTSGRNSYPWFQPNTGLSHSIIIQLDVNPTIDGMSLTDGDLIGAFYDSSGIIACAGYDTWTGRSNIVISAAGNDATTSVKDGFNEGEKFQWKIWRQSDSKSFDATAIFHPIGALGGMIYSTDTFVTNGLSAVASLSGLSVSKQQIAYRAGWNLISSYIEPRAASLDSVFASNREDLILLKNGMQKSYLPSQNINQIGNWVSTQGYQAKFMRSGTLTVMGRILAPEATLISLTAGWNLLPFLGTAEMPIISALAAIKDHIVIVKDQDGKTYLPSININQIGTMKPGQAYLLKILQTRTFSYPFTSLGSSRTNDVPNKLNKNETVLDPGSVCPWSSPITGTSHTALVPTWVDQKIDASVRLESGDAVGVFYDSSGVLTCAGHEYWDGINSIAISAAGDDPTTLAKDGFITGDSLKWRIWKRSTGEVLNIKPSYYMVGSLNSVVTSEGTFEVNGISAISSFGLTDVNYHLEIVPEVCSLAQNFPNPFNPVTTISYKLSGNCQVKLEIYNQRGQLVECLVNGKQQAGSHLAKWQCRYGNGIYFYKLSVLPESSDMTPFTAIRKMIMLK